MVDIGIDWFERHQKYIGKSVRYHIDHCNVTLEEHFGKVNVSGL